jgi:hypothetical protein
MKKILTLLVALVIGAFLFNPKVQAERSFGGGRIGTVTIQNTGLFISITILPIRGGGAEGPQPITIQIPIPSTTAAKSSTFKVNNEKQLEAIIKETLTKAKVSKSTIQSILQQIDDELEDYALEG